MPITAATVAAQVRAWMERHLDDPPPRDRATHAPPVERLGLAEGWLTLADVARAAGETVAEAKARIYGGAP